MSCEPLDLSTIPPSARTVVKHCANPGCSEILTLECEFDTGICVDCQADLSGLHSHHERTAS
jgi:hypothetical protein